MEVYDTGEGNSLNDSGIYSHLKKRRETVVHITAITIITTTGIKTLSIGRPSEAALRSFIPCVNGNISANFCSATGITS